MSIDAVSMRSTLSTYLMIILALAARNAAASAQSASPASVPASPPRPIALDAGARTSFERVDQTVSDINPLRFSLYSLGTDLRAPTGFEAVFRIPNPASTLYRPTSGSTAGGGADERLARISGALTAVFPRSDYFVKEETGLQAKVPADTVYYIGRLPAPAAAPISEAARAVPESALTISRNDEGGDDRVRAIGIAQAAPNSTFGAEDGTNARITHAREAVFSSTQPGRRVPSSIVNDDAYRSRRLSQLLVDAAAARSSP